MILIAVYLVLANAQILKNPLTMDEVDYYQCMANTVDLGLPLYYAREAQIQPDLVALLDIRVLGGHSFSFYKYKPESGVMKESYFALTDGNSRYTWCMWHPPLYVYLGSLAFRLYDLSVQNSSLLRYINLVFSFGTFAGIARLSRRIYPRYRQRVLATAFLLYVTCDLAVRGSILVDYNASLAPCVATWFALSLLDSIERQRITAGLILMVVFALSTSFGLGLSLLLGSAILMLAWVVISGRANGPWSAVAAIGIGIGTFLAVFWTVCNIAGLPFEQPFLHSLAQTGVRLTDSGVIGRAAIALRYIVWYAKQIGLAPCVAVAVVALRLIVAKPSIQNLRRIVLPVLALLGVISQASWGAEAYGFPKYVLFVLPGLFVCLAGEVVSLLSESRSNLRLLAWGGLATVLATQVLGMFVAVTESGYTLYNRGQVGIVEAGQALAALTRDDEVLLCSKDVGFYAERKFVEWYGPFVSDADLLRRSMESEGILYAAKGVPVSGTVQDLLESEFILYGVIGGHEILGPSSVNDD